MFGESIGRVKMRRQVALFGVAILAGTVVAASPAHAADTTRPVIKSAVMGDTNGNDHSDRITLTYSEPIKHLDDKDGTYPFRVAGYKIREILPVTKSTKLVVLLTELTGTDIAARPQVVYAPTARQPV